MKMQTKKIIAITVGAVIVIHVLVFMFIFYMLELLPHVQSWCNAHRYIPGDLIYDFDTSDYKFIIPKTNWFTQRSYGAHSKLYFDAHDAHTKELENTCEFLKQTEDNKRILVYNSETFTEDGLFVIVGERAIYYFDIDNKKLIRKIALQYEYSNSVNIGGRDLLFFDGGNLYRYDFESDTAILLHEARFCEFEILKVDVYPQFYKVKDGYTTMGSFTVEYQ